jgi:hypothetical protein
MCQAELGDPGISASVYKPIRPNQLLEALRLRWNHGDRGGCDWTFSSKRRRTAHGVRALFVIVVPGFWRVHRGGDMQAHRSFHLRCDKPPSLGKADVEGEFEFAEAHHEYDERKNRNKVVRCPIRPLQSVANPAAAS